MRLRGLVPPFQLPSSTGGATGPGPLRSKYNLVLAFVGGGEGTEGYLRELARAYPSMLDEQARVLAVVVAGPDEAKHRAGEMQLPFALLADQEGSTTARMVGSGTLAALCVADRFGEVYCLETGQSAAELPPVRTALEWLQYIQAQCPE